MGNFNCQNCHDCQNCQNCQKWQLRLITHLLSYPLTQSTQLPNYPLTQSTQFTPDIICLVGLMSNARTSAAMNTMPATHPNRLGRGMDSKRDPAFPASQFPMLDARNQMPMMKPTARCGASLVMALRPTGLRQSSPIVCKK